MPFYDIHCTACSGTFETMLAVSRLHTPVTCPYCRAETVATPAVGGGRVALKVTQQWRPRNPQEQLAGRGAAGPGTAAGAGRSSVLHNCKGFNCSLCA